MTSLTNLFNYQARWNQFASLSQSETWIVRSITFTFVFYLLGALYLVAPIIGWTLLALTILRWVSKTEYEKQKTLKEA